jgi:predicted RND superfamily exporter protein
MRHQEPDMHIVGQASTNGAEQLKAAIVLVAVGIIVFWRAILQLLFAAIAIAIVVALGAGVMELLRV